MFEAWTKIRATKSLPYRTQTSTIQEYITEKKMRFQTCSIYNLTVLIKKRYESLTSSSQVELQFEGGK